MQHIHCNNLTDASLILIASTYPHLQSITIRGDDITDAGLLAIADKCHELTSVIISYCRNITSSGLSALWAANPNLTDVDISWNEFTRNILKFIFDPYLKLTKSNSFSGINTKKSKYFDCDINKVKSKRIASHLINNWYIAYLIAKNNNSEFIGILQPWVLTSEVNYDYLTESEKNKLSLYKTHLDIVYENIIFEMNKACNYDKEFCKSIINGVDWLKNKENVFIDFGHTNGEGNKIISEKITQLIKL